MTNEEKLQMQNKILTEAIEWAIRIYEAPMGLPMSDVYSRMKLTLLECKIIDLDGKEARTDDK